MTHQWWSEKHYSKWSATCTVKSDSLQPHGLACQVPLPMEFSRREYWSGVPLPLPGYLPDSRIEPVSPALAGDSLPLHHLGTLAAAAAAKSLQSSPTLCHPIDGSPPGSPVPGILQARTLEWVAISFSNAWKWKVKVKLLSCALAVLSNSPNWLHQFTELWSRGQGHMRIIVSFLSD